AYQDGGEDAMAVRVGGRHFIGVGRRMAAGTGDAHPVVAHLLELDVGKVTHHIRQQVGARVTDFINNLLANGGTGNQAAGVGRLGQNKAAVFVALGHREAHVVEVGHQVPVGEVAAIALGAALDHVAGQRTLRKAVVVVQRPVEFV